MRGASGGARRTNDSPLIRGTARVTSPRARCARFCAIWTSRRANWTAPDRVFSPESQVEAQRRPAVAQTRRGNPERSESRRSSCTLYAFHCFLSFPSTPWHLDTPTPSSPMPGPRSLVPSVIAQCLASHGHAAPESPRARGPCRATSGHRCARPVRQRCFQRRNQPRRVLASGFHEHGEIDPPIHVNDDVPHPHDLPPRNTADPRAPYR